jgi:hypothetical protein
MVKQGVLAVNPWEEAPGLDPGAVHHLFLSQQTRVGRNTQEIWCGVYSRSSVSSTLRKRGDGIAVDRYERKLS